MHLLLIVTFLVFASAAAGQPVIDSAWIQDGIKVTTDRPAVLHPGRQTIIIFYALPNGNTTEQTMGKRMQPGDDWHYDIQHIRAQTAFIREQVRSNVVVIYLENKWKSWPAWKQRHPDFPRSIPALVDSLAAAVNGDRSVIYLNGHSGGGSFIFGFLAGVDKIPAKVRRITFMDSNYGYDSTYYPKILRWLKEEKHAALNVFAYNDSVALYNGKPVVSATGGTWYRSHLMLQHLQQDFSFRSFPSDSIVTWKSRDERIRFFFKPNVNRGIYHTQQVELNGFIHSVLCGTGKEEKKYRYYGKRAYDHLVN